MKVVVAKNSGFCFGVRRAIESVYDHMNCPGSLYTLGPIIHNPQVVDELKKKGVLIEEDIDSINDGTVVIRSHGVVPEIYEKIENKHLQYVDATCPFVRRIHKLVKAYYQKGFNIIIVGEREHPEVVGINGWANNQAWIITQLEDVEKLPSISKACVVAQTTITSDRWEAIIQRLQTRIDDLRIFNTICNTTSERQKEAEEIAKSVDVMWVIGGKNSSNTKKLYSICKTHCKKTFAIETVKDINVNAIDPGDKIGIIAGASTPDWIIKEVVEKMSQLEDKDLEKNENLEEEVKPEVQEENSAAEQMNDVETSEVPAQEEEAEEEITTMEGFEESMVQLRPRQIVKGTVLRVSNDEVAVNIGYKSDGIIPASELALDNGQSLEEAIKEGDEIEVEVVKVNDGEGNVLLSQKSIAQRKSWKDMENGFKNGEEFSGKGVEVVKGGIIAQIKGVRAFVPASQLSTHYVEDLSVFVGKPLRLKIIEMERGRNRVVASQRAVLEAEEAAKSEATWASIQEGQKIHGVVKRLTNFGAFVDIGGVDGLIHISDLSWGRIGHPKEVVKEGQEVEVVVLGVDRERERISLGYKQTIPHPWDNIENKYPEGSIVNGKVVRIASFGAFVELEPGVDGLVHISQVANRRIDKVEDVLKVGQEVEVKVLEVKPEEQRIGLSIRETLPQEKEEPKPKKQEGPTYKKEEMTVNLGEFFPDELTDK